MNSESEGWIYKDKPKDAIIEIIKNAKCTKCNAKRVFCDCWIEDICDECKNLKIACVCM